MIDRLAPLRLAFVLPLLAPPLPAQDLLDPLVVTALRTEAGPLQVPYSISRITDEQIRDRTRRTLPEALQFTPGVMIQKTTHGHGSPFIRGFTGRQNLLMVDGVRINNSLFRSGPIQYWNTVDPLSLERIELIRSQGSVLYGSDAVGGTVNALTRSSNFRERAAGEAFTSGSLFYEFRSHGDDSHVGRLESAFGVGGRWGVLLGVSAKDFGDIRDSAQGLMRNTGYPEQDLDLRLDYEVAPGTTLTFLHQRVNQDDVWRWHSTLFNPGWQHSGRVATPGRFLARVYDQERTLTYLRLASEHDADAGWIDAWQATLSFLQQRDREAQDRLPAAGVDRRYQIAEVDTLGLDLGFESGLGPGKLVYGLDYYHDWVDGSGYRDRGAGLAFDPSFRPVADDSDYDLFGAYAQYVWTPLEALDLTLGGRFTHARAELGRNFDAVAGVDRFDQSRDWSDFSGSLRALYRLDACNSLFAGVSQAFRAPNLTDLSGNLTTRSGVAAAGAVDLEPEEFITAELGWRHRDERFSATLAGFYTWIDQVIVQVPTAAGAGTSVAANGQDGEVYGIEAEGAWRFAPCWELSGYASWQEGSTETPLFLGGPLIDDNLSRVLPLSGSLALRWTDPSDRFWVAARVLAAAAQDKLSRNDLGDTQRIPIGGTPSYVTWMLHAGWRASQHLEFTAGIENLLDEDYRIHGSGQNESGLNFILSARASW